VDATKVIVITGLSGAGKTQAVRCLEDLNYFCIDNLPADLVPKFVELIKDPETNLEKVGIVMDIRGGQFFSNVENALEYLDNSQVRYELVFLEASDEALVRRFKETRRRHPVAQDGSILEGIMTERQLLEPLRGKASKIIDTSELIVKQLRDQLIQLLEIENEHKLVISIVSFGYKYGIPLDADLVMDVRFIPNPFYVSDLKHLTGEDRDVQDYVLKSEETKIFHDKFTDLIRFLIPHYINEGKSQLVIAIGCTGGQHRSVTLANELKKALQEREIKVILSHRDIMRSREKK
jgi:UPF0042 nucleotide-binding protein